MGAQLVASREVSRRDDPPHLGDGLLRPGVRVVVRTPGPPSTRAADRGVHPVAPRIELGVRGSQSAKRPPALGALEGVTQVLRVGVTGYVHAVAPYRGEGALAQAMPTAVVEGLGRDGGPVASQRDRRPFAATALRAASTLSLNTSDPIPATTVEDLEPLDVPRTMRGVSRAAPSRCRPRQRQTVFTLSLSSGWVKRLV